MARFQVGRMLRVGMQATLASAALMPSTFGQWPALHTWVGDEPGERFGVCVAGAGDVDNDGRADLIVGATDGVGGSSQVGEAHVF